MHSGTEIGRRILFDNRVAKLVLCHSERRFWKHLQKKWSRGCRLEFGSDDHSIVLGAPPSEEDFADAAAAAGSIEERSVAALDATVQVLTRSAESSVLAGGSRRAEFGSGGSRLVGPHSIDCFPMEA